MKQPVWVLDKIKARQWIKNIFYAILLVSISAAGLVSLERQAGAQTGDHLPLVNDALTPPDLPLSGQDLTISGTQVLNYYQTSEYMIGRVAVGIILVESDGRIDPSSEDWTDAEKSRVHDEIVAATQWWAAREPAAKLTFAYDDHWNQPLQTSYEPISRPIINENLWIGEAMAGLGYPGSSYFTQVRDYVNGLRSEYETDWAFAIFVVDSSNDADDAFSDGHFAYAYMGGPFMVMTWDNAGYGIENMDAVATHEMGHIFMALDQYSAAHQACTARSGYLDVENQNSLYGACSSNVNSIMRGGISPYANASIDRYAREQIGWRDSDADGVLDPVDTTSEITLVQGQSIDAGQPIRYSGSGKDIPFPSPRRRTVTVNHITAMSYRLNEGEWLSINPADGAFDSDQEPFAFDLPLLSEGIYRIDMLVNTSLGGERLIAAVQTEIISTSGMPMQTVQEVASSTTDNTLTYTGLAVAVDSVVASVQFRIDDGEWQSAQATDDAFDTAIEAFVFTTPPLNPGEHTIQVQTVDSRGQTSSISSCTLSIQEVYAVYLPLAFNGQ